MFVFLKIAFWENFPNSLDGNPLFFNNLFNSDVVESGWFFAKEFNKKSSSVGFPIEELKLLIINDFLIAKFQR